MKKLLIIDNVLKNQSKEKNALHFNSFEFSMVYKEIKA